MAITVPTYQRQTGMTTSVPAASLSVRADVAGLTQTTRAQTQFAEQVQQTGQFAFHTFLGQHREAELAKHDAETTRELDKVRAEAAKMGPKESLDYYERASKAAISRISSGIKDPVLQHRYTTRSTPVAARYSTAVRDSALKRLISQGVARIGITSDSLTQRYIDATNKGNVAEQDSIIKDALGFIGDDGEPVPGLWESAVKQGLIDPVQARAMRNLWIGDLLSAQVLNDIRLDPRTAIVKLQTPGAYRFNRVVGGEELSVGLGQRQVANFLKTAESALESHQRDEIIQQQRQERLDKAEREARWRASQADFLRRDGLHRGDPLNNPAVTEQGLLTALEEDGISSAMFKSLRTTINDNDAQQTDVLVYVRLSEKIRDAGSEDELNAISDDIFSRVGPEGDLKKTDALSLQNDIDARLVNDPRINVRKSYRTMIKTIFSGTEGALAGTNWGTATQKMELASALRDFDDLAYGDEVEPLEAYNQVMAAYRPSELLEQPRVAPFRDAVLPAINAQGAPTPDAREPVAIADMTPAYLNAVQARTHQQFVAKIITKGEADAAYRKIEKIRGWMDLKERYRHIDPAAARENTAPSVKAEPPPSGDEGPGFIERTWDEITGIFDSSVPRAVVPLEGSGGETNPEAGSGPSTAADRTRSAADALKPGD